MENAWPIVLQLAGVRASLRLTRVRTLVHRSKCEMVDASQTVHGQRSVEAAKDLGTQVHFREIGLRHTHGQDRKSQTQIENPLLPTVPQLRNGCDHETRLRQMARTGQTENRRPRVRPDLLIPADRETFREAFPRATLSHRRLHIATVVELQHATESFTAFDPASDGIRFIDRLNQFIAESLMISFAVVMLDVFTNGVLE